VLAQALASHALRGQRAQHLVHERRQGARGSRAALVTHQHQREIVAQAREVAVGREGAGNQAQRLDRLRTGLVAAGREESALLVEAGGVVHWR
jgi:hypothetical protein